jgi:hypothetical protein
MTWPHSTRYRRTVTSQQPWTLRRRRHASRRHTLHDVTRCSTTHTRHEHIMTCLFLTLGAARAQEEHRTFHGRALSDAEISVPVRRSMQFSISAVDDRSSFKPQFHACQLSNQATSWSLRGNRDSGCWRLPFLPNRLPTGAAAPPEVKSRMRQNAWNCLQNNGLIWRSFTVRNTNQR